MDYFVYKFIGKNNEVLYVGQTIDVDRRMQEHKGKIWDLEKDHIEYARCENMADMCLYEMYYINKLHAKYNDSLVYNVEPSFTLPELNFQIYDQKLVDKMHEEVINKVRNNFADRFNPENYWANKRKKLEDKLLDFKGNSEEEQKILDDIKKCDENIER